MKEKIKLCFFGDYNGVHLRRWIDNFNNNIDYEVNTITFLPEYIKERNVSCIKIKKIETGGGNWQYLLKIPVIRSLFREYKPQIINAHYLTSYGFLASLLKGKSKVVQTIYGTDLLVTPKNNVIYRWMADYTLKKADFIISDSELVTDVLKKDYNLKEEKILTIVYGVPDELLKETCDLTSNEIICTRNFEKLYNFDYLIKALPELLEKLPDVKINLLGKGSLKDEIQSKIKEIKGQNNVFFPGYFPYEEMKKYLKKASIYIAFPYSDATSLALLEAMALGLFPVVSDIPANRYWIQDGVNGFLFDLNNHQDFQIKLEMAYNDLELRKKAYQMNKEIISLRGTSSKNFKIISDSFQKLLS